MLRVNVISLFTHPLVKMKYLIQTLLANSNSGGQIKYEIYSDVQGSDSLSKIPEGTCRVISYKLVKGSIQLLDDDLDLQALFDANRPAQGVFYPDGPHRVNLEMLVDYLHKQS
ncbi:hypothetical protein V462_13890 [Pantoea ananatis 15320]|nr:hypothetical protein V462_13890 [Pantoea ananatis 15320]